MRRERRERNSETSHDDDDKDEASVHQLDGRINTIMHTARRAQS